MIRKFGNVVGIDGQPTGLDIGVGGGSNVKSIQRGTLLLSTSGQTVTITGVDLTKSILKLTWYANGTTNGSADNYQTMGVITNATTLTFTTKLAPVSGYLTVSWEVIEFNNVKSLQSGQANMSLSSIPVTITAVNTNKSIIFFSYKSSGGGTYEVANVSMDSELTNSTTITFKIQTAYAGTISWFVIEFN